MELSIGGYDQLIAYDTITTTWKPTYSLLPSGALAQTITTTTDETWDAQYANTTWGVPDLFANTVHFNTPLTTTNDAVVHASNALTSGVTEYGTRWWQVAWENTLNSSFTGGYRAYTLYIYEQGVSTLDVMFGRCKFEAANDSEERMAA